jgi:hypothetical protein
VAAALEDDQYKRASPRHDRIFVIPSAARRHERLTPSSSLGARNGARLDFARPPDSGLKLRFDLVMTVAKSADRDGGRGNPRR